MPDTFGPITAVRSLLDKQGIQAYLAGKQPRAWPSEQYSDRSGSALAPLRRAVDLRNAKDRAYFLCWENQELHALQRDRRYASRSRRWLYTRGYQTKLIQAQEQWLLFTKFHIQQEENSQYLRKLLAAEPKQLAEQAWDQLLQLPNNP